MHARAFSQVHFPAEHQAMIPPPPAVCHLNWEANENETPCPQHRIFCNRTLDLASVSTIGFDMVRTGGWPHAVV